MSASFVLELDTTAPDVEWGEPSGTTAGELLQVPYTSDEPIAAAELRLADGRQLAAAVMGDRLELLLPADTPAAPATLAAADDVGNLTTHIVVLDGVVVVVQPQPRPGWPAGRARRPAAPPADRVLRHSSPIVVTSATSVHSRSTRFLNRFVSRATAVVGSGTRIERTAGAARLAQHTAVGVRAATTVAASSPGGGRAALQATTTIRRRDGGETEALLLDLY